MSNLEVALYPKNRALGTSSSAKAFLCFSCASNILLSHWSFLSEEHAPDLIFHQDKSISDSIYSSGDDSADEAVEEVKHSRGRGGIGLPQKLDELFAELHQKWFQLL